MIELVDDLRNAFLRWRHDDLIASYDDFRDTLVMRRILHIERLLRDF